MKKLVAGLSVAVLGVLFVAACSSSDDSGTNYSRVTLGPAGAELQVFYADWEKGVPMDAK